MDKVRADHLSWLSGGEGVGPGPKEDRVVQRGADGKTGDSRVGKWKAHRLLVAHRYVSFGLENELVAHTEKLSDFTCDSGFPASFDEPDLATGDWHSCRGSLALQGTLLPALLVHPAASLTHTPGWP